MYTLLGYSNIYASFRRWLGAVGEDHTQTTGSDLGSGTPTYIESENTVFSGSDLQNIRDEITYFNNDDQNPDIDHVNLRPP